MLCAELLGAAFVVAGPGRGTSGPAVATPAPQTQAQPQTRTQAQTHPQTGPPATADARTVATPDGRTAELIDLGAPGGAALLDRIAAELPGATDAVTAFWGPRWRRDITIVAAGNAEQFQALAGAGPDTAATTSAQRITFSPAAAAMSPADLRIVLRHELFHYAARDDTAADAPVWLTEGVADYVGRPPAAPPPAAPAQLPSDSDLVTPGPQRSAAYDRAWEFASFVAHRYGAETLRDLYLAACGHGHADVATAVRRTLGADLSTVLAG